MRCFTFKIIILSELWVTCKLCIICCLNDFGTNISPSFRINICPPAISTTDIVSLHPDIFLSSEQVDLLFQFNSQSPPTSPNILGDNFTIFSINLFTSSHSAIFSWFKSKFPFLVQAFLKKECFGTHLVSTHTILTTCHRVISALTLFQDVSAF